MEKVNVIVRASALHDERAVAALKGGLLQKLREASGLEIEEVPAASSEGLTAILVLTGGVEREVLKVVAQLPSPVLLIAHPGHNSLPASLEILARIRQDGGEGRILFGTPEQIADGLREELRISSAWEALRFSRIGLVGEPSEWLVASDVDRAFLKGRLSIEVVQLPLDDLFHRIDAASATRKEVSGFTKRATSVVEPSSNEIRDAVTIYNALRDLVDDQRLAACTVRCFDLVLQRQNTGCYALSRLNDEKIPASCEGDLQSMFSMYIAYLLTGQTAFMANIASVEPEARIVGIAHCTCPLSMTTEYTIRSHFESGLGIGISGSIPAGPCTLFRLGGERLDQLFIREGQTEAMSIREDLCRTQVRVVSDEPIDELLNAPLGNHHILIAGHHRASIERFFRRYLKP